jgi:2-oxoisovalerate dehydrogenase E2 component (dihydrolipoyl transacylase)
VGGGVVAPVIVSPQVAILGVGRSKAVPAFDEKGQVVRREEAMFSWSADHRVVDGAMMARFAEIVKKYLEQVESMMVRLR